MPPSNINLVVTSIPSMHENIARMSPKARISPAVLSFRAEIQAEAPPVKGGSLAISHLMSQWLKGLYTSWPVGAIPNGISTLGRKLQACCSICV